MTQDHNIKHLNILILFHYNTYNHNIIYTNNRGLNWLAIDNL